MGLLMSILVGCVGVLEILACLRHVSSGSTPSLDPAAPCLSYHSELSEKYSSPNSLCTYSHTRAARLPRGVRHKLENLHEYSLKVKRELRALDKHFDESTLSECSTNEILGNSRPDSSLSLNDYESRDHEWTSNFESYYRLVDATHGEDKDTFDGASPFSNHTEELPRTASDAEISSILKSLALQTPAPTTYQRIPTPIPFATAKDDAWRKSRSASSSSSERKNSFDDDSGNEAPTTRSFDNLLTASYTGVSSFSGFRVIRSSTSPENTVNEVKSISRHLSDDVEALDSPRSVNDTENLSGSLEIWSARDQPSVERAALTNTDYVYANSKDPEAKKSCYILASTSTTSLGIPEGSEPSRKKRNLQKNAGTTITRKPTRLKSKNAEISKSAENLKVKKTKRSKEPERRKSDISIQTVNFNSLRDEATNTSPADSDLSRSESRHRVSVEVQTSFDDHLLDDEDAEDYDGMATGLSESKRDLSSRENSRKKSFRQRRFRGSDSDAGTWERSKNLKLPIKASRYEEVHKGDYEKVKDALFASREDDVKRKELKPRSTVRTQSEIRDTLIDEEFADLETESRTDSIEYSVPDTEPDKAFWVVLFPITSSLSTNLNFTFANATRRQNLSKRIENVKNDKTRSGTTYRGSLMLRIVTWDAFLRRQTQDSFLHFLLPPPFHNANAP